MSHHCDLCRRVCDCGQPKMTCQFCAACRREMDREEVEKIDRELPPEDKANETQL